MVRLGLLVLGVAALAAAGAPAAWAGSLASATLSFQIAGPLLTLPPTEFPATGATGSATGTLSATLGPGTAFAGTVTTTVPSTAAPPITAIQVQITNNAELSWAGGPVSAAFGGVANVQAFGGLTLLGIPLKLGSPSTLVTSHQGVTFTTIAAAWTAGATTVTGLGPATVTYTAMATGSNGLTPGGQGALVLVTPLKVISGVAGTFSAFGVLTLTYVPEPGTLGLLGGGVLALAALGRRRL
jgi:hypothetical protein